MLFGDYHKLANVEQEFSKVGVADIQRVVKQYFVANNRTVGILVPDASQEKAPGTPNGGAAGEKPGEEKQ